MLNETLKPCPCGAKEGLEGDDVTTVWEYELGPTGEKTGRREWTVWCGACGRKSPMRRSRESAEAAWNSRDWNLHAETA